MPALTDPKVGDRVRWTGSDDYQPIGRIALVFEDDSFCHCIPPCDPTPAFIEVQWDGYVAEDNVEEFLESEWDDFELLEAE